MTSRKKLAIMYLSVLIANTIGAAICVYRLYIETGAIPKADAARLVGLAAFAWSSAVFVYATYEADKY